MRDSWLRLSESERQAVRDVNPRWVPPRPALDALGRPARDNDSGEDFLFMHRRMIALADDILARVNDSDYPRVEGWRRVPPPGDADYPVPEFPDSELEVVKSPAYFRRFIARWERQYTDPQYLKGVTLGQLGSDIEFTVCHDMHVRWAARSPVGYRQPEQLTRQISEWWDAPAYDYLGDTYSSHVNLLFWKIHGWVDERIEDWKSARGIRGEIEWRGTWVGPLDAFAGGAAENEVSDEMQRVDSIISESAASGTDGFYRPAFSPYGRTATPCREKRGREG
ncbi:MAG: Tat pathway signal protein [Acidobacteria bacterium]|nr:Tat pathway signal protein [Acidobacteriota bacterium]